MTRPTETLNADSVNVFNAPSSQAKGMITPTAMTVPGNA